MAKTTTIGTANVNLTATTADHDKKIDKSKGKIEGFGKSTTGMSLAAKAGWTGVGASALAAGAIIKNVVYDGTMSYAAWNSQLLKTEALINATSAAAGFSSKELANFAKQRDLATLGDRDNIMGAINILQTFKSVSGDVFKETIIQAQNMASVIGGDVKSQVTALGKALEDPTKGISALSRSGVSFTDSQKEMIKGLVESNKKLEAQKLILKELDAQYGGTSEAMATGMLGAIDTLDYRWKDLKESFEQTDLAVAGINKLSGALEYMTGKINGPKLTIDEQIKKAKQEIEELTKLTDVIKKQDVNESHIYTRGGVKPNYKENNNSTSRASIKANIIYENKLIAIQIAKKELLRLENLKIAEEEEKAALKNKKDHSDRIKMLEDEAAKQAVILADRLKATNEYDKFVMSSMDKNTKEYQDKYIEAELEKWGKVKGITAEQLSEIERIETESFNNRVNADFDKELFEATAEPYEQELQKIIELEQKYIKLGKSKVEVAKLVKAKLKKLNEEEDEDEEDPDKLFKGIKENFTQAIQSEMTGLFSDVLRGELDDFEDYFESFTDGLVSMWSSMMSKMVMDQMTGESVSIGGMGAGASFGAMAGAGAALGVVSHAISSRNKKAEEAERARMREELQSSLDDSIAKLEMNDFDFQMYEINKNFDEMAAKARAARLPLDDIIKLRKLETDEVLKQVSAGYDNLNTEIDDWVEDKQRESWNMSDWRDEYNNLSDSIVSLDRNSDSYRDDSLDLLTDQFDILKKIYSIQEDQLRSLQGASDSLTDQISSLLHSDGMPVSKEEYKAEYEALRDLAFEKDEDGYFDVSAIADFQNFADEYINVMASLGDDYNGLITTVTGDLSELQQDVQSEIELLTEAVKANTEEIGGADGLISEMIKLQDIILGISKEEIKAEWQKTNPFTDMHLMTNGEFDSNDSYREITAPSYTEAGMIQIGHWWQQYTEDKDTISLMQGWLDNGLSRGAIEQEDFNRWDDWLERFPEFNSDVLTSATAAEYVALREEWMNGANGKPEDFPAFEKGGFTNEPSIFGEAGPEWAVPAYNNPNNENFLKSVGIDQVITAINSNQRTQESNGDTHIHFNVDGKEYAHAIVDQLRKNPELKRAIRTMLNA